MLYNFAKSLLTKTASRKLLKSLFFLLAEVLVSSTKTDKDDKFLAQIKEAYGKD